MPSNTKKKDVTNAYLEYSISSKEMTIFEDGKKREVINTTIIDITISADDKNGKTYELSFTIDEKPENLKKLAEKPSLITDKIIQGETFLYDPYLERQTSVDFSFDWQPYANPSNAWGAIIEGKILMKISIPENHIFLWIKSNFQD